MAANNRCILQEIGIIYYTCHSLAGENARCVLKEASTVLTEAPIAQ